MVCRQFIENNLEKRGLSAAVRTDDPHALAFVHSERDICQDILMSIMDGYVSEIKHCTRGASVGAFVLHRCEREIPDSRVAAGVDDGHKRRI